MKFLPQRSAGVSAVFFLLFFLYVLFGVQPRLIYYYPQTYLYKSPAEIAGFLDIYQGWAEALWRFYPGCFCDRLGAELVHYFAVPWLGALVITASAVLLSFLAGRILSAVSGKFVWLRFLPSVIALVYFQRYENVLGDALSLIAALAGAVLYWRAASSNKTVRIVQFLAFSAVMIVLSKALLVFILLCVIDEIVRRRSYGTAALQAVAAVLFSLPWLPKGLAPFMTDEKINYGLLTFYCAVPAAALASIALHRVPQVLAAPVNVVLNNVFGRFGSWGGFCIVLAASCIIVKAADAPLVRNQVRLNYYLCTEQWEKLLHEADRRPPEQFSTMHSHIVDLALFHEGRLLEDLFAYPQDAISLILYDPGVRDNEALFWRWVWSGKTLFELGLVNNAENTAYEALARVSHYPEGLRLLALTHMAKGMPGAAKVFLRALRKDIIHRPAADGYLRRIEKDSTLAEDREINEVRARMPVKDAISGLTLQELFEHNPRNRMAFEYMVAQYLIDRNLDSLSASARYFTAFDYAAIPKSYEEALIILLAFSGKDALSVRPETMERFRRFSEILARYKGHAQDARNELAGQFGDSYFFYYLYGYTGRMR